MCRFQCVGSCSDSVRVGVTSRWRCPRSLPLYIEGKHICDKIESLQYLPIDDSSGSSPYTKMDNMVNSIS